MALVISLPLNINAPGFVNFNVTDETLETKPGLCAPPIGKDSKERIFSCEKF